MSTFSVPASALRVARALQHLRSIPDPLERIAACDATADDARAVQGEIAEVRRQAIYEATLKPGETGESVAAVLGISSKSVSAAIGRFRQQDLALIREALSAYVIGAAVTRVSAREIEVARATRDVLHAAKVLLRAEEDRDLRQEDEAVWDLLETAVARARQLAASGNVNIARPVWDPPPLGSSEVDYSRTPSELVGLMKTVNALPGIHAYCLTSEEDNPGGWDLWWSVLPSEQYESVEETGPSGDGWLVTEWLVWFFSDLRRAEYDVDVRVGSAAPFINTRGESMSFFMMANQRAEGLDMAPDAVSKSLRSAWEETGHCEVSWPQNGAS